MFILPNYGCINTGPSTTTLDARLKRNSQNSEPLFQTVRTEIRRTLRMGAFPTVHKWISTRIQFRF